MQCLEDQLSVYMCVCVYACLDIIKTVPRGVTASSCPPTVSWLTVYTPSLLTLRWLQRRLNAHLTHSLPLWCNPVEVISFTGLSTSANMGVGVGVGWSGVGVSLCLISLPQSIPLNKISYDVQRKDVSTED